MVYSFFFLYLSIEASDSPRFFRGNWINFGITLTAGIFLIIQHTRYVLTNKSREKKWSSFSDDEKKEYLKNTKHEGSNRLDYRFRI
jgi:hypothetical protein